MTIVITGGSGFVGGMLTKALLARGDTVIVVDLFAPKFTNEKLFFVPCDLRNQTIPFGVLEHADAVVNLAGAPISQKWTEESKKTIYESRIFSTRNVVQSIEQTKARPSVFVCASAIGFYGDTGEAVADEKSPMGQGFLAALVKDWEEEAQHATVLGVRVVSIRTAPVLGRAGMLAIYSQTARFGFLVGLRKDFTLSWIHIDDLVAAYLFAIDTSTVQGVVNAVAPEVSSYKKIMRALGHTLRRKVFFVIPKRIAEYVFGGEGYQELTVSQSAAPTRLLDKGFSFAHPNILDAIQSIYTKK